MSADRIEVPLTGKQKARQSIADGGSRAVVRQYGETIKLPEEAQSLRDQLVTRRHVVDDIEDGIQINERCESLINPSPPRPNAGLVPIVTYGLLAQGYRPVTIRESPVRGLPPPAIAQLLGKLPIDLDVLDFVRGRDHGVVRLHPGVDVSWIIAELALAWPDQTNSRR